MSQISNRNVCTETSREYHADCDNLKKKILASLKSQGYKIKRGELVVSNTLNKNAIRALHQLAIKKKLDLAERILKKHEPDLVNYIANGDQVAPEKILPKLIPVYSDTKESLLFRYASLHWSIPVSSGYGRRLRFLVMDQTNDKLIGIIGLGDPVFALGARDKAIGWTLEQKKERLFHVMDAFVLGAVPPYSSLLCGKLIAMLALSNEVRELFSKKYRNSVSLISQKKRKPILALITTTSAFGRSSMYNRLKINGREYWWAVGYTTGTGDFHFSNGIYDSMNSFVKQYCVPTARHSSWGGSGFRNRREVIKKVLGSLKLPFSLINHKVCREVILAPLGHNTFKFLRGEQASFKRYDMTPEHIFELFKDRWLLSRAKRDNTYKEFKRDTYILWR